jgi:hypothetical protein
MEESEKKVHLYAFNDVGERYATYGENSTLPDIDKFIRNQKESRLAIMMMVTMVKRLGDIRGEIGFLRKYLLEQKINNNNNEKRDNKDKERDGIADGMLLVLRATGADVPIILCDRSELSIRARKAIWRGQFQSLDEITEDRVRKLRNCGISTWKELEKWKRDQYDRLTGSNGVRLESLDTGEK